MNATAKYYNHLTKKMISIEVKDSYKLITMPLRNFGKCFKLTQDKEVMPYGLYTANNIKKNWLPLQSAIPFIKEEKRMTHEVLIIIVLLYILSCNMYMIYEIRKFRKFLEETLDE